MPPARAHVFVRGDVQGVGFRYSTLDAARSLGLAGWVRNCADGSVEAVFEGPRDAVEQMVQWSHRGPPAAHVTKVDVAWEEATGKLSGFRIAF